MHTISMKIVSYDEDNQALLVSFASNTTASSDPADYEPIAFQPAVMWPEITDTDELLKNIALRGIEHLKYITAKEQTVVNTAYTNAIKSLVGANVDYATRDLVTPTVMTPFHTV